MICAGYRGCEGGWGNKSDGSPKQITSQAPASLVSPKPRVGTEVVPPPHLAETKSSEPTKASANTQNSRGQDVKLPQQRQAVGINPFDDEAPTKTTSQVSSATSSSSIGSLMDNYFRKVEDVNGKKQDSFWVSPSLAAWLTGKAPGGQAKSADAEKVKDLVEQAANKTGRFKPEGESDDSKPEKESKLSVDIDYTPTDNAMKKLIITGDPEQRKQAVNILKELTSKCQKETATSLIDSWQMFSDDRLREETPSNNGSSRGNPKFGMMSGAFSQEGSVLPGDSAKKDPLDKMTITRLRRNLVGKYEREVKVEEDHNTHRSEHEEHVPTQVLKLSFPLATLPVPDTPKSKFEAELKKYLSDFKKEAVAVVRVNVSFKGEHITADIIVVAGALEELRSTLSRNPPVVCGFKAIVPEKKEWCNVCQKHHGPDKLCYKSFQTDGGFDASLTSFLGECNNLSSVNFDNN